MDKKHLLFGLLAFVVALALSLWLGISFYNNLEAAKSNPETFDPGNYVITFFLLAVFTFAFYILSTMQLRLHKKRGRWLGWLGVLGPLGVIIVLLVKEKQPEPEPEPLPEPEEPEPMEETLEAKTIQVRTPDGRIINLKTVGEVPEELEQGEGELLEEQGQESEKGSAQENETSADQETRNYGLNEKADKTGNESKNKPSGEQGEKGKNNIGS